MKKTIAIQAFISLLLILSLSTAKLSAKELSQQSKISLLTCSPGEELYSLFGHSALRIKDPKNNLDIVFNYGTFDFNTPNFYMKFARGKLKYRLAYSSFKRFTAEYIYLKRGITEQQLNLNLAAKQKLFRALVNNYRPENRYYSYDFLFDNCSTRIRDIVENNSGAEIKFENQVKQSKTFWNLLDFYMNKSRWIYLGIHLILGSPCDIEASAYQYMFLPDNMMYAFENAEIVENGTTTPLVSKTQNILRPDTNIEMTKWYFRPGFVFGILASLLLVVSIWFANKKTNLFVIDQILFGATGLLGWIIIFLWFFTDHQATGPNWNILWALPLHFPLANILLFLKSKISYFYFLIISISLLLILASWSFIPQSLPNEILPFVALLLIRSLYIIKKLKLS